LQVEFSQVIQKIGDETGREIRPTEIWNAFEAEYLNQKSPFACIQYSEKSSAGKVSISATIKEGSQKHVIAGKGNGPIDAFVGAMNEKFGLALRIVNYQEQSMDEGASSTAMAFVEIQFGKSESVFGVGMNSNVVKASLDAILSAINRALGQEKIVLQPRGARPE
jgi:2-isopropylmalate synthase